MADRDLRGDSARGRKADAELELTNEAFDALRASIIEKLIACSPMHTDKILRLQCTAQMLDTVRDALKRTVVMGKHADALLAAEEALAGSGLTRV